MSRRKKAVKKQKAVKRAVKKGLRRASRRNREYLTWRDTPDYLPKVIEDPNAAPCAQCGANKPPPREPPAKTLTGLPVSGKVLDLKAGDPVLRTVFGKPAAAPALAAAGVPPVGEPYVDCVCPGGQSLGWMCLGAAEKVRLDC